MIIRLIKKVDNFLERHHERVAEPIEKFGEVVYGGARGTALSIFLIYSLQFVPFDDLREVGLRWTFMLIFGFMFFIPIIALLRNLFRNIIQTVATAAVSIAAIYAVSYLVGL